MHLTTDQLKAALPVTFVLHVAGHQPAARDGRDIMYAVPWRNDGNASLACYASEEGGVVDRWKDMARTESGDIFDLIARIDPSRDRFPEQVELARGMHERLLGDDWVAPEPLPSVGAFDVESSREELRRLSLDDTTDHLGDWLHMRQDNTRNIPASWLRQKFNVFTIDGEIRAPYGDTGLYKYRRGDDKFKSPGGTRGLWNQLYGQHLDTDPSRTVVLCEGETDVWSGTHATEDYVFLGLPTGAGTRPEKLSFRPSGRRVLIALDADQAGRDGALLWADCLSQDNEVLIVPMPEGKDLSDMPDIERILSKARPSLTRLDGIVTVGNTMRRANRDGDAGQAISDFVATPNRVLIGTNGALSYEVDVAHKLHLLTAQDLLSKNAFTKWASDKGQSWTGSDNDLGVLRNNLAVDSLFVPVEAASSIEGVHEDQFVWADGYIGPRPMRHVPEGIHARLDIRLSDVDPVRAELQALLRMGDPAVVHPILAWAAAAPYRSQFERFPILNIAGASGSGKTTLIEEIIHRITGSKTLLTLTSTTKFAVTALVASTNAFPVVFDEYRPGARSDSMTALQQIMRDAYNGTDSQKSAGGNEWNVTQEYTTLAPLVVSGEQSIDETSLIERMILVHLTRQDQRNPQHVQALKDLQHLPPSLSHFYLSSIVHTGFDVPVIEAADRVEYNMEMLRFGWASLKDFTWHLGWHGIMPDDPDLTGVQSRTVEVNSSNPVVDALKWALGDKFASENVWVEGDELVVQAASFVRDVKANGTFTLPGNNGRTITDLLQKQYGAATGKRTHPEDFSSKRKDVLVMSCGRVFGNEVD
jgi:hypothetical protein